MIRKSLHRVADAPGNQPGESRYPTRQALFPMGEPELVSPGALIEAERSLTALGFDLERVHGGAWKITWPGSALTVWRYSPAQLCQFAQDQALSYALAQQARCGRQARTATTGDRPMVELAEVTANPERAPDEIAFRTPRSPTIPG